MKTALLSNVNMNITIRLLKHDVDVYESEGYGNELGILLNPLSSLYTFNPDIVFLIVDFMEIIHHELSIDVLEKHINNWFSQLEAAINNSIIYYISDAYLWGAELNVLIDKSLKHRIENIWEDRLLKLIESHRNVRIFPYHHMVEKIGEDNAFSSKMWYMGRIIHSNDFQKLLSREIINIVDIEKRLYRKVLLLDLDNTLWGGLAGENDITPIELSDEHTGLVYKNLQRVILQMKNQGVILGIVSKNNETDVMPIINEHPHMILRNSDFSIKRINWKKKSDNIEEIISELNVALDSVVFFDDNPSERQLIREIMPDVVVPEFPALLENLPNAMVDIWKSYFERTTVTDEDRNKTRQYIANVERNKYRAQVGDYNEYLQGLDIYLTCVDESKHVGRITQLINKTNQFNLATRRYSQTDIESFVVDDNKYIYAFHEKDCFGDNGIISVVFLDVSEDVPIITDFVMSCRVMGKNIEYAIVDYIENELLQEGYNTLYAEYVESTKNAPVKRLYDDMGYTVLSETESFKRYSLNLGEKTERKYILTILSERKK